jgi:Holliday junction resolvase
MSQLESKIQSKILKELKALNIYAHKNITTNKKGIPDIIVCYNGLYLALEVKRPGGKPTELQMYNIEQIRKSGGVAEIVYSWEDVTKILRSMTNEK